MDKFLKNIDDAEKHSIAIDFDGVIHRNSKGFHTGLIYDKVIEGSKDSLEILSKKYTLIIYTCKANPDRPLVDGKTGTELVEEWLDQKDMLQYIDRIVWGKPNAKFYIEDKAIRFENWNQTLSDIEKYDQ